MPLTPEDVSNKRFTPVRLREGYDMGEVDQFLDLVEAELTRLRQDNDELRARMDVVPAQPGGSTQAPAVGKQPAAAPGPTPADASGRAARLLEIAANNADQLVS